MPRLPISIVGLGYVGLATAVCFAKMGFSVRGIDVDKKKLEMLAAGRAPLKESGLDLLLGQGLRRGLLSFGGDFAECVGTDVTFIAVGTPSNPKGAIDLAYVKDATIRVGQALLRKSGYHTVVVKSTVVPGTTLGTVLPLLEEHSGKRVGDELGLAMNPEFLFEGSAIADTLEPDALVVGGYDRRSSKSLLRLYEKFYRRMPPTLVTSPSNAELIKYSVNCFRAVQSEHDQLACGSLHSCARGRHG